MTTTAAGVQAPELLESRFAAYVAAGDLEGILGLYAVDAVVSLPRGREAAGPVAIRAAFAAALEAGALGAPSGGDGLSAPAGGADEGTLRRPGRAIVSGDLAMTTTTTADGSVRTQVARREPDGSWVWVRDGSRLRDVHAALGDPASAPTTHRPDGEAASGREFGTREAVA